MINPQLQRFFFKCPAFGMANGIEHFAKILRLLSRTSILHHQRRVYFLFFNFFLERQNGFREGVLGSFSIDLMDSWTIDFFYPQLWGWLQGVVFVDR